MTYPATAPANPATGEQLAAVVEARTGIRARDLVDVCDVIATEYQVRDDTWALLAASLITRIDSLEQALKTATTMPAPRRAVLATLTTGGTQ